MSNINTPLCVIAGANTGIPGCTFTPEKMVGAILIPKNKTFTDVELEILVTTLQTLALESSASRVYPIFRFEEIADNSESETIETLGYGAKKVTKDGKYDWTFRMTIGGLCLQNKLRRFNNTGMKVLFVDSNNIVFGTRASNGETTGMSMDFFYAKPFKVNDGGKSAIFEVRFGLSKPAEFNENIVYIQTGVDVEESVKGLIDLELTELAVVAGKATIGIKTACDKVDIYETYADELADGALWSCKKAGVVVVISGVVKNDVSGGWDVSFVGTGDHVITLASPSDLAAASVGGSPDNGFEGGSVTVTMPAP